MKRSVKPTFDEYYGDQFGDRWVGLREALQSDCGKVYRVSHFAFPEGLPAWDPSLSHYPWAPECVSDESVLAVDQNDEPIPAALSYRMDISSVLVARALGVEPGMEVADLCAAPGGKALILAEALSKAGHLLANEYSRSRRFKLLSVLNAYLPSELMRRVTVRGWDGVRLGLAEPDKYDRILVDAPCSAEGHLLGRAGELARWSPSRTKQLARRQYALLCSALLGLRPGGRLIYATCSISPEENDGVVSRLLKRKAGRVRQVTWGGPLGEPTAYGWRILPDQDQAGPAYFSLLEKNVEPV